MDIKDGKSESKRHWILTILVKRLSVTQRTGNEMRMGLYTFHL